MQDALAVREHALSPRAYLQQEEARLDNALKELAAPYAEARLAAYRIRKEELWKAATDDRGQPRYQTLGEYFQDRWAPTISRTLFFSYGSTLMRLSNIGLPPETITANGPSHDFDHSFTLRVGRWDYRGQELREPASGLLSLQEDGEAIEATVKRLYLESKADAEEYGVGEALHILDQKLGKLTVEFFQDSLEDAPLRLRVEVTHLRQDERNPILVTETFHIGSDKTLPREVVQLLKKRRWVRSNHTERRLKCK